MSVASSPDRRLSVFDGVAILVGTVVGFGIFSLPQAVAAAAAGEAVFLSLWVVGGIVAIVGALCYAELATAEPDAGGEYRFLTRAWGGAAGFLFVWARLTIIQTGAIALVAFIFGDHAQKLIPLGPYGESIHAAIAVIVLTLINLRGASIGAGTQRGLTVLLVVLLAGLALASLVLAPHAALEPQAGDGGNGAIGLALIFVLLTYSGWNETAYVAGELRDPQHGMVRVLLIGVGIVLALYLGLNFAYLRVLGLGGLAATKTPAVDLAAAVLGDGAAVLVSILVILAMLSTLNAAIFTGARASYAWGRDNPRLGLLGRWDGAHDTPVGALLAQGVIALVLVGAGTATRSGFSTMVDFTSPVFWLFLLLVGMSVFRFRSLGIAGGFRVPLYPVTPALFCIACAYMLYASLAYTGVGALFGLSILALGIPAMAWVRRAAPVAATRTNV